MKTSRTGAILATISIALSLFGATTAFAAEPQVGNESHDDAVLLLTEQQIERFTLDSLDVGDPQPNTFSYRSYGYYPGGMNSEEAWFCAKPWNWGKCSSAKSAADDALKRAKAKFPGNSLYLGKGDAYRHCYWSARMTIDMGAGVAKGFGDRHESESSGDDKRMDLANNATGRSVGLSYRSHNSASNRCEWLAQNNRLVTLK